MSFDIYYVDERGNTIAGIEHDDEVFWKLLSQLDETSFPYLALIDPYGDTTFNRLQMSPFKEEWTRLAALPDAANAKAFFVEVAELARRCQSEPHHYLKFVGD